MITIPAYVLDDEYQAHMIMIGVDIVDAKIPMLFGAKSLDKAEAVMKFGKEPYLASTDVFGSGVRIPLTRDCGHYVFFMFPPTEQDNKLVLSESLNVDGWTEAKVKRTVSYIVKNENPKYEAIGGLMKTRRT